MYKVLIIAAIALLSGCTTVKMEIGAGQNYEWVVPADGGGVRDIWDDAGGVGARLALRGDRQFTKRVGGYCGIFHLSQWDKGWPFNKTSEDSANHVGCGVSVTLFGSK